MTDADRQGPVVPADARRPARHRRRQRGRQDDADQAADRRARAGFRRGAVRFATWRWRRSTRSAPRCRPTTTLVDALTGGGSDYVTINGERKHVIGYMKDFLFAPEQARTPIEKLSGGERGRLMLARALAAPSNLLVLDEPTNDLDIETLDLLQEMLGEYPARSWSSATTAISSTASRPRCSSARATGAGSNTPAAIPTWSRSAATASPARRRRRRRKRDKARRRSRTAARPKRKLTFNEKRALETLPARMDGLRAIWMRSKKLADRDFAARDPPLSRGQPYGRIAWIWKRWKTSGSRSKSCARRSRGRGSGHGSRIPFEKCVRCASLRGAAATSSLVARSARKRRLPER